MIFNLGKDDFQKMLVMWGEASVGSGCNLGFSSGHGGKCASYDVDTVDCVERAMCQLKLCEPGLFELLKFRYVCHESPRSLLDLRFKFKVSERQIAQLVRDGEHIVRGFYYRDLKVA